MTCLITTAELAQRLGLSLRTVDRRRRAGTLNITEINISSVGGSQPRFRLEDVEAFITAKEKEQ